MEEILEGLKDEKIEAERALLEAEGVALQTETLEYLSKEVGAAEEEFDRQCTECCYNCDRYLGNNCVCECVSKLGFKWFDWNRYWIKYVVWGSSIFCCICCIVACASYWDSLEYTYELPFFTR